MLFCRSLRDTEVSDLVTITRLFRWPGDLILISMLFFLAFRQGLILVQAFLELTMYSRLASNPWQSCLNLLIVGIIGTSYHYRLFLLLKMIGKKKKTDSIYSWGQFQYFISQSTVLCSILKTQISA